MQQMMVERAEAPSMVLYKQEPAKRPSNMETDAWIPAVQAAIVAAAWAVVAGLMLGGGLALTGGPWWVGVPIAFVVLAVLFALQVTGSIQERQRLLWKLEERTQQDGNGDGTVGQPARFQVELWRRNEQGQVQGMQLVDFGVEEERARALAKGVLAGRALSEAEWTGNGRPFSRRELRGIRSELLERGLLEWRNVRAPAQGVQLTAAGRAVFERLAGQK